MGGGIETMLGCLMGGDDAIAMVMNPGVQNVCALWLRLLSELFGVAGAMDDFHIQHSRT